MVRILLTSRQGIATLFSLVIFSVCLMIISSCDTQKTPVASPVPTEKPASPAPVAPPAEGSALYLAQAQFIKEVDPVTGESKSRPGPARLSIWTKTADGWSEEVIEDPESDVFHKAAWFKPVQGEPGILTISARQAHLKIWRRNDSGVWTGESLWNPVFGGTNDRLRDFELKDVNDDGLEDICIATHDQGVVAVLRWEAFRYVADELTRRPDTFVHEIETGDVDGDGISELFTTPSSPNKMDGSVQPGGIDLFQWVNGRWEQKVVEYLDNRHAKEILCAALDPMQRPVLFTALEGERIGGEVSGDTTRIRMYTFDENSAVQKVDIATLPGHLCRFLTIGDTDGDGKNELIASTNKNGIWRLDPMENGSEPWKKTLVATGTSGFEHSTYLADLNGDGVHEIYVASDNQGQLRQYTWNGRGYSALVIGPLKDDTITFNVVAHRP
ncbi:VCBS repeat-containing protein [bacterium]|nr:VCBS repeat-containing protein [candidate division CSSED10-310 bacterium]